MRALSIVGEEGCRVEEPDAVREVEGRLGGRVNHLDYILVLLLVGGFEVQGADLRNEELQVSALRAAVVWIQPALV